MNQLPANITIADYFSRLHFDRVETYSFQRGATYEETLRMQHQERDALNRRRLKTNGLSLGEERRLKWLEVQLSRVQCLIDEKGDFHTSCEKTASLERGDQLFTRLKTILDKPQSQINPWMCAPIYRDALVFYSGDNIDSALNVCLSCNRMEAAPLTSIEADDETYVLLRRFFIDIGHEVEF